MDMDIQEKNAKVAEDVGVGCNAPKVENDSDSCKGIESSALKRGARKSVTNVGGRSCSQHAELMDRSLWSNLPEELKELVFARVPWPQIYQLRTLCKEMRAGTSWFQQACVKAQPKLFALLSPGPCRASIRVNMFDIKANRWHKYQTSMFTYGENMAVILASDGGLVCSVSRSETKSKENPAPLNIFVCNPLSQAWKQLPPLPGLVHHHLQKVMVQLIMDRDAKQYRVIFVAQCQVESTRDTPQVYIYHSRTGQWTREDLNISGEVVIGYLYNLDLEHHSLIFGSRIGLCSYNFGDGKLLQRQTNQSYSKEAIVKDHLFEVTEGLVELTGVRHRVSEYKPQFSPEVGWTHLKDHTITVLTAPTSDAMQVWYSTCIYGCKDFLVLLSGVEIVARGSFYELCHKTLWLYDLCTFDRHELPRMPGFNPLLRCKHAMCELWCDAIP